MYNTAEENNLIIWLRSKSRINYFVRHFAEIYLTKMHLDILRFIFYETPEDKLISSVKTSQVISNNLPYHDSSVKGGFSTLKKLNLLKKIEINKRSGYSVNPFYIVSNPYNTNEHIFNYYQEVYPELFNANEEVKIANNGNSLHLPQLKTFKSIKDSFIETEKIYLLSEYNSVENIPRHHFKCQRYEPLEASKKQQMLDDNFINIIHYKKELRNKIFKGVNEILRYQIEIWIGDGHLVQLNNTKFKVNTVSNKAQRRKSKR